MTRRIRSTWRSSIAGLIVIALNAAAPPGTLDRRGIVKFQPRASRIPGSVQQLPMVVPNQAVSRSVASRINAALQAINRRGQDAATGCREQAADNGGRGGSWHRRVAVTMAGPSYLSFRVTDSYYCGGPYPNDGLQSFYVYDLATGRPVNWRTLFPRGIETKPGNSSDGGTLGLVAWSPLLRRALAQAPADCAAALRAAGFAIGLDGRTGELIAVPSGLPHAAQACAGEMRLTRADLHRSSFAPALMNALAAASRY